MSQEEQAETEIPEAPAVHPVSKQALLRQLCRPLTKDERVADIFYFRRDFYEVFRDVLRQRKKQQGRGFTKSHLLIEALLQHPDMLAELRKQGSLK